MKKWGKTILTILLLFTTSNVKASTYCIASESNQPAVFTLNTRYDAACYHSYDPEMYDIELEWDDLHLSLVNSGDADKLSNTLIKNEFTVIHLGNDLKKEDSVDKVPLFNDSTHLDNTYIVVKNNSSFAVDIIGRVEDNYKFLSGDSYVRLDIASCGADCYTSEFSQEASIENLLTNKVSKFIVKPTVTRYNNDTAIVMDNIKLTFRKSNM